MSILKLFCHVDDFCQLLATWENAKLLEWLAGEDRPHG